MEAFLEPNAFLVDCPSRELFIRLGEKWTMFTIAALKNGPVRFGALHRRIEGISKKMLAQSLKNLQQDGLVARTVYDEMPLKVEYELTVKGKDLLPLIIAFKTWAEESVRMERDR